MLTSSKKLFGVLSTLFIIGILTVVYYDERSVNIQPSYRTSSMSDIHLTHRKSNSVEWDMSAEKAIMPQGSKDVYLRSVLINIRKSPEMRLTSEKGIYKMESGDITLENKVQLLVRESRFTTSALTWNRDSDLITAEGPVRFSGKKFLVKGRGLTARLSRQKVRIMHNVQATFYL